MKNIKKNFNNYLNHCITQKRLDEKTIKAYRIDLSQFINKTNKISIDQLDICTLEKYIAFLNNTYTLTHLVSFLFEQQYLYLQLLQLL